MNKAELKQELSRSVNGAGMMTVDDVKRFLGRGRTYTQNFLHGVDCLGERKGKLYYIGDIADRIIELRK